MYRNDGKCPNKLLLSNKFKKKDRWRNQNQKQLWTTNSRYEIRSNTDQWTKRDAKGVVTQRLYRCEHSFNGLFTP